MFYIEYSPSARSPFQVTVELAEERSTSRAGDNPQEHSSPSTQPDMVLWQGDLAEGVWADFFKADIHAAWLARQWPRLSFSVKRVQGPVQEKP